MPHVPVTIRILIVCSSRLIGDRTGKGLSLAALLTSSELDWLQFDFKITVRNILSHDPRVIDARSVYTAGALSCNVMGSPRNKVIQMGTIF